MLAGLTDAGNLPVLRLRGSGAAMQAVAAGEGPGGMWAAWRRMERAARLPTQAPAFAAALASTLLAGACVEVFLEEGALLALVRDPGFLARWRMSWCAMGGLCRWTGCRRIPRCLPRWAGR